MCTSVTTSVSRLVWKAYSYVDIKKKKALSLFHIFQYVQMRGLFLLDTSRGQCCVLPTDYFVSLSFNEILAHLSTFSQTYFKESFKKCAVVSWREEYIPPRTIIHTQ